MEMVTTPLKNLMMFKMIVDVFAVFEQELDNFFMRSTTKHVEIISMMNMAMYENIAAVVDTRKLQKMLLGMTVTDAISLDASGQKVNAVCELMMDASDNEVFMVS